MNVVVEPSGPRECPIEGHRESPGRADTTSTPASAGTAAVGPWTQPFEMVAAFAAFVMVLAAQWASWFHAHVAKSVNVATVSDLLLHGSIHLTDMMAMLIIPYYLGWFAVFGVCAATVTGSARMRRVCAPAGIGLLGAQTVIVFAILHTRGVDTVTAVNLPTGVSITRAAGGYTALVSIALLGLAMLPALTSNVRLPSRAALRGSLGRADMDRSVFVRPSDQARSDDDDDPDPRGRTGGEDRMAEWSGSGRAVEAFALSPQPRSVLVTNEPEPRPDHSAYRRPVDALRPDQAVRIR